MSNKKEFDWDKLEIIHHDLPSIGEEDALKNLIKVFQDKAIEAENNPIVYTINTGINKTVIDTFVVDREYLYKIPSDVPGVKNVSTQKLSPKTKDKLKKAIKKSDLYDTIYFYYDELDSDTVKKELDDLLKDIIEIIEHDGVIDGNN